ncbi:MAG TPA: sigma-70 family RNA polymerase sigma factor [Gemmatimonadales bacterium]|nr:sigma-70 family RNA polymerase sigma factor [Gemmatimonadales bacterium]
MVLLRFLRSALTGGKATPAPPPAQTDINVLIEAHLAGDPKAFGQIVARYQVRLLNFVYRMIGDRERAEDLVQEAFLRVYRHLDRFDRTRKFSTWIYTIASNLAKNELRNRSRSPLVTLEQARPRDEEEQRPVDFEDPENRPDELYERRNLKALVDHTVARLSSHHREVFVLRELEGKSYEEIAEIMHCNLGTVKSRLNRARQSFAELIGPHLE